MNKVIPVFDHSHLPNVSRMPLWIRQPLGDDARYGQTASAIHNHALHTVCEEARCPNRGECWSQGTATFMILGDTCTRACGFCAVKTGKPDWFDSQEAKRVAEAAARMNLDYVVVTSVNRDDMQDGGAKAFADTIVALRQHKADMGIELLTPDFHRKQDLATQIIAEALQSVHCDTLQTQMVWGHNVETVPDLYRSVRKGSDYQRSLDMLEKAAKLEGVEAKSAIMLGLGETETQVMAVLEDLLNAGVKRLAMGQYLRPSKFHIPVKEYIEPEQFDAYAEAARQLGFSWVKSGPLVRSSYHAHE